MPQYQTSLCWFRRDLRWDDHAALYHALRNSRRVFCVFVFDTDILDRLHDRRDRRVEFIWHSVNELRTGLERLGGGLIVLHGSAQREIPALAVSLGAGAVYCNRDYEPAAAARDGIVARKLRERSIACFDYKDQVIFDRDEILTQSGKPFSVFTPYKRAWLKKLDGFYLKPYPIADYRDALAPAAQKQPVPSLPDLGFEAPPGDSTLAPGVSGAQALLADFRSRIGTYREYRDYPALEGPSYLSAHLRFGTISVRTLASMAWQTGGAGAETWLSELIWRDFYQMILYHHPQVVEHAFRPEYDAIAWPNPPGHFDAWCRGATGYPLVDAAMRQLNQTGYMHNRLRMVTASFLSKDLHVDWRLGEEYFAARLLDFDLASNNGGWQWAASTGCDAQPWFRIFNPVTQSERFDPEGKFIRRHVPELTACPPRFIHAPWRMTAEQQKSCGIVIGRDYPAPLVSHEQARQATLALYRQPRPKA